MLFRSDEGRISSAQGKIVFAKMLQTNKMPDEIIKEEHLEVVSDTGAIEAVVDKVIAANPKAVEDFKKGKTNVIGFLTGQVMKESKGKMAINLRTRFMMTWLGMDLHILELLKRRKMHDMKSRPEICGIGS